MLSGRKEGREEDNMFRYEPACVNFSSVYAFYIISPLVDSIKLEERESSWID